MLLKKIFFSALSLFIATAALAETDNARSTLSLPKNATLLVLDGNNAKSLKISGNTIPLKGKRHQIVFQLSSIVANGMNRRRFTSDPFVMTFDTDNDTSYKITGPAITTIKATNELDHNPAEKFQLRDQNGADVPFKFDSLPNNGVQIGRDYASDTRAYNQTDKPAATGEFTGLFQYNNQKAATPATTMNAAGNPEMSAKMLQYWFQQADKKTRTAFLKWAQQQG